VLLIIYATSFGGLNWDQDVLDATITAWNTKIIDDVQVVSSLLSCPDGYSAVEYNFPGTKNMCVTLYDETPGLIKEGICKTKSVKVKTGCSSGSGDTCVAEYKKQKLMEGITIIGMEAQGLSSFMGNKVCYRRGDSDYMTISKSRKEFAEEDIVSCSPCDNICGGSLNSTFNTGFT